MEATSITMQSVLAKGGIRDLFLKGPLTGCCKGTKVTLNLWRYLCIYDAPIHWISLQEQLSCHYGDTFLSICYISAHIVVTSRKWLDGKPGFSKQGKPGGIQIPT